MSAWPGSRASSRGTTTPRTSSSYAGAFRIEIEGHNPAHLSPGELFVVPRGLRHRPVADAGPAYALLIERTDTKQYGEAAG